MNIITQKQWGMVIREPLQGLNLNRVDAIALHHMAHPTADIKTVESWHLNQGWRAFGYNFWVGFDGSVYEGRGFQLGAGVENQNGHVISIGFQGDYHSKQISMPDAQFNSGIDIINYVKQRVPQAKICGHRDLMATACPGQYFPMDEFKQGVKRMEQKKFADCVGHWAENHINKLYNYGIVNGDENGNFNPDQPITRAEVAVMVANALTICGK